MEKSSVISDRIFRYFISVENVYILVDLFFHVGGHVFTFCEGELSFLLSLLAATIFRKSTQLKLT